MKKQRDQSGTAKDLARAMANLEQTIARVSEESSYVLSPGKNLFINYLRGVVYGLGALTAVAIVIPLILSMLHRVEWVPIVGDFVSKVATQVEQVQRR